MSGGIALSNQLRTDIDDTRNLYRKTHGRDIGIGKLLEMALLIYRAHMLGQLEPKRQEESINPNT